jgi:cytochrome c oxidase assembly protein subunit 15
MLVALVIAAIPLLIIYKLNVQERIADRILKIVSTSVVVIILVQIVLGTQVREQIDEISKSLNYSQRELWIARLDNMFIAHRSFSWLVAAGCLLLFWKARVYISLRSVSFFIISVVIATILLGVIMAWFNIPALAQPLHLLFACILILAVFTLRLKLK